MRVTRTSRLRIRIENILFVVLFISALAMVAWLSTRYHYQADWTASGRNTLSQASRKLLKRLEGPIEITAYAREDEILRSRIEDLVKRYRRHKPDLELKFVNPDTVPDRVRELGISIDGEMIITYRGQTEHLKTHSEQAMSNVLQRVARSGKRWLVFITGHGERDPLGNANHDFGIWGRQLEKRGFNVQTLNLLETKEIPGNTSVLIIAGPQVDLLEGEVAMIRSFLEKGGNLLWLADPGEARGMEPIGDLLGLEFHPGVIVDPTTQML
ncbi:MAG: GldG family protein, partial [Gammaproteobacteria bacterium]|nr:GldG family protein [Gammaproteobacteria bacterium]